jgi:SAM-dependent methyltransferase
VWLPQLPDIHTRLQQANSARVADIGCGAGWASIAIAQAYPNLIVDGFDNDGPSIAMALANAAAAGVADRVHFHVHDVAEPIDGSFDLVAAFMMLHDVSRPVETLRVMREAAGQDGTAIVMDTRVADEFVAPGGPVDRFSYVFSLLYCLPLGLAEQPSAGTGTVMRIDTLRGYARAAGFDQVSVLPIEHDFFRFYRLTSRPGTAD